MIMSIFGTFLVFISFIGAVINKDKPWIMLSGTLLSICLIINYIHYTN